MVYGYLPAGPTEYMCNRGMVLLAHYPLPLSFPSSYIAHFTSNLRFQDILGAFKVFLFSFTKPPKTFVKPAHKTA